MPRTLFEDAYRNSTKGAGYEVQNASAGRITNCMHSVEDFVNLNGQNERQLLFESHLEEILTWKWAIFRGA